MGTRPDLPAAPRELPREGHASFTFFGLHVHSVNV